MDPQEDLSPLPLLELLTELLTRLGLLICLPVLLGLHSLPNSIVRAPGQSKNKGDQVDLAHHLLLPRLLLESAESAGRLSVAVSRKPGNDVLGW